MVLFTTNWSTKQDRQILKWQQISSSPVAVSKVISRLIPVYLNIPQEVDVENTVFGPEHSIIERIQVDNRLAKHRRNAHLMASEFRH